MNRSRVTGDLASHGNIFVDIANDRVGIGSTIPGQKLSLPDSARIAVGNSADLELYHDGTTSHLANKTGQLRLGQGGTNVELYYGGVKCFHTHGDNGGSVGLFRNLTATDDTQIMLGASADYRFFHEGSSSKNVITCTTDGLEVRKNNTTEVSAKFIADGAVELYHDGGQIFRTESAGIVVSGNVRVPFDGHKILLGASQDLQIYHDGSHSYIDDTGTGNLKLRSNNFRVSNADESKISATFVPSGAVELYHNHSKKFETSSIGVTVTGKLTATGDIISQDDIRIQSAYPRFYLTDTDSNDDFSLINNNGSFLIYNDTQNDFRLKIDGTTGMCAMTLRPTADSTYDLGTNTLRWANVYADTLYGNGANITNADAATLDGVDGANYVRTNQNTTITSDLFIGGGGGGLTVNAASDIRFTDGNWTGNTSSPKIQAHSNYLYIVGGSGGIIFRENATDRWHIEGNGHFIPKSDSAYDIGTTGVRVRNGYFDALFGDGSNITGVNATTLDSIDSGSFLRSDAADTFTNALTFSQDNTDVVDFSANSSNLNRGISFNNRTGLSAGGTSNGWLRLNNNSEFTNGVFTPGLFRVDGSLVTCGQKIVVSVDNTFAGQSVGHTATYDEGIFWHTDNGYGIYRTSGAWSGDYQQLKLKWLTGIILDGGNQYGKSGVEVVGDMNNVFRINTTNDGKIQLKGSSNPYIRFQEGTTDKAYIQWNASGFLEFRNQEDDSGIRLADDLLFSNNAFASGAIFRMWHAGNDGSGSGLDADTLDGIDSTAFIRTSGSSIVVASDGNNYPRITHNQGSAQLGLFRGTNSIGGMYIGADVNSFRIWTDGFASRLTLTQAGSVSTTVQGTLWGASNDGSGSGLDADTLDGVQGANYVRTNNGNQSIAGDLTVGSGTASNIYMVDSDNGNRQIHCNSDRIGFLTAAGAWSAFSTDAGLWVAALGLEVNSATGNASNITMKDADHGDRVIHCNSNYIGFLTAAGAWGSRCDDNGNWEILGNTAWHAGNDGSGSGLDADTLDGTHGGNMIRSGAQTAVTNWHISGYRNGQGTSPHFYFSHSGGYGMHINTYNTTSSIYALELHNNSKQLMVVYNNGECRHGGTTYPASNNSYDLGTSSLRWRNIYTNDLNLSNEGGANDVDGTWGNFTIQEGEDDLFLINKRNGKKYKFNLTEVS